MSAIGTAPTAPAARTDLRRRRLVRGGLVAVVVVYVGALLLLPLVDIAWTALRPGWHIVTETFGESDVRHAFLLTGIIAAITVVMTAVFGVIVSWVLVRQRFRGRAMMNAFVDLPFALSPVTVGLAAIILFGRSGWFADFFDARGIQIVFALPSMILVTIFISIPFVIREVQPVLEELGTEEEDAARTLGASVWKSFFRVTMPNIRWALLYGVALSTARAIGEIGAVLDRERAHPGTDRDRHRLHLPSGRGASDRAGIRRGADARRNLDHPARGDRVVQATHHQRGPGMTKPIVVEQLTKRFGDFAAVDDVTFTAPEGAITALLGPSGSGKSTVLRMIAGLEEPTSGRIWMGEEELTAMSVQERRVGFVFQHYALFRHMTVGENVAFGLKVRKESKTAQRARVDELLELVQLAHYRDRYPDQLSGGQRQRVALARALAPRPQVLLLDEPFGALDARVRQDLRRWLDELHRELGVTSLLVTHDQEEALELAQPDRRDARGPDRAGRARPTRSTTPRHVVRCRVRRIGERPARMGERRPRASGGHACARRRPSRGGFRRHGLRAASRRPARRPQRDRLGESHRGACHLAGLAHAPDAPPARRPGAGRTYPAGRGAWGEARRRGGRGPPSPKGLPTRGRRRGRRPGTRPDPLRAVGPAKRRLRRGAVDVDLGDRGEVGPARLRGVEDLHRDLMGLPSM